MKKLYGLLVLLFINGLVFGQKEFVLDANASMRPITGRFSKIKISGPLKVYLSQSAEESLAISASEEKFKEMIKTVVKNNVLHIYIEGGNKIWRNNINPKVYVSFKELNNLEISGASSVMNVGSIKGNELSVDISGACKLAANIDVQELHIDISGASKAIISGSTNELFLDCSGASDFTSFDLVAQKARIDASGASDVAVKVTNTIQANASGASRIYYKGNPPDTELKDSGASKISAQNRK